MNVRDILGKLTIAYPSIYDDLQELLDINVDIDYVNNINIPPELCKQPLGQLKRSNGSYKIFILSSINPKHVDFIILHEIGHIYIDKFCHTYTHKLKELCKEFRGNRYLYNKFINKGWDFYINKYLIPVGNLPSGLVKIDNSINYDDPIEKLKYIINKYKLNHGK